MIKSLLLFFLIKTNTKGKTLLTVLSFVTKSQDKQQEKKRIELTYTIQNFHARKDKESERVERIFWKSFLSLKQSLLRKILFFTEESSFWYSTKLFSILFLNLLMSTIFCIIWLLYKCSSTVLHLHFVPLVWFEPAVKKMVSVYWVEVFKGNKSFLVQSNKDGYFLF